MKATAEQIIQLIGGKENIASIGHCMTRLRLTVKDIDKVDLEAIKGLSKVLNAQYKGGQVQIIMGPEVGKYFQAIIDITGEITEKGAPPTKEQGSIFDRIAGALSGIFIPAVAAISAAGLIKAVLALLSVFGWISPESDVYTVLNMLGDAPFYFLPILLGFSTAIKIKTNPYLAASLGALLVYPTLVNGAAEGLPAFSFIGIPIPYVSYTSTVLPIIFSVIVLKYVYDFLNRFIPANLELVFTVALSFLITSIVMLAALAPLGNYLGVYLAKGFTWLFASAGPVAGMVMCGLFAVLVMTGLAYGTFPLVFQNLGTLGYDYIVLPFMVYSNVNQGIAALAASLKLKNKSQKSVAMGAGITAILGITEPAMYTVNLRYKKPFYSALIGSAIAGFLSSLFAVKVFEMAGGGIAALPAFASTEFKQNILFAILSLIVGGIVTFGLSYVWTRETDLAEENDLVEDLEEVKGILLEDGCKISLGSVGHGELIDISQVPDPTFSEGIMGKGVAIDIQDGRVYAPADGEVAALFPTGHAIGLKSKVGVEVLIHIGVDTVKLEGEYFTPHVKSGAKVKKGDLLISFDYDKLKASGVYTPTIVLVTNTHDYDQVMVASERAITVTDDLMEILI